MDILLQANRILQSPTPLFPNKMRLQPKMIALPCLSLVDFSFKGKKLLLLRRFFQNPAFDPISGSLTNDYH